MQWSVLLPLARLLLIIAAGIFSIMLLLKIYNYKIPAVTPTDEDPYTFIADPNCPKGTDLSKLNLNECRPSKVFNEGCTSSKSSLMGLSLRLLVFLLIVPSVLTLISCCNVWLRHGSLHPKWFRSRLRYITQLITFLACFIVMGIPVSLQAWTLIESQSDVEICYPLFDVSSNRTYVNVTESHTNSILSTPISKDLKLLDFTDEGFNNPGNENEYSLRDGCQLEVVPTDSGGDYRVIQWYKHLSEVCKGVSITEPHLSLPSHTASPPSSKKGPHDMQQLEQHVFIKLESSKQVHRQIESHKKIVLQWWIVFVVLCCIPSLFCRPEMFVRGSVAAYQLVNVSPPIDQETQTNSTPSTDRE